MLVKCQRLRRALAREAPEAELRDLANDILGFFESDMRGHFQEEDDLVVPAARARREAGLQGASRTVEKDHGWFKARFRDLAKRRGEGKPLRRSLRELEARLTRHVRFEEETLFEGVQQALSETELQILWRASAEFRREHRAPSACRVKPPSRSA